MTKKKTLSINKVVLIIFGKKFVAFPPQNYDFTISEINQLFTYIYDFNLGN